MSGGSQPSASAGPSRASSASTAVAASEMPASANGSAPCAAEMLSQLEMAWGGESGNATAPGRRRASSSTAPHVAGAGSPSSSSSRTADTWQAASVASPHWWPA